MAEFLFYSAVLVWVVLIVISAFSHIKLIVDEWEGFL